MLIDEHPWPAHTTRTVPWRSSVRLPRTDRRTTSISASIPPFIAAATWTPDQDTEALLDRAATALTDLDAHHGADLGALGGALDRTEAVASSRIEQEPATLDDVARAVVGVRANASAVAVVRAGDAIERLVSSAGSGTITPTAVLDAHRALMRDDPVDGRYAGRYRDVQNWIGGGVTPRHARHVPPPPELVPALMDDLFAFLHRDDPHPVAQAAIGHAQFESIHPFTDGNGRIGRALVGAVLRRRGLTRVLTVPIATALVAEQDRYFWHLERYRVGRVDEWVLDLAIAVGTVCDEATLTALLLAEASAELDPMVRSVIGDDPVLTEDHLADGLREAGLHHDSAVDTVADDLCRRGVLRAVTERRRNRAWVVVGMADELAAFGDRVRAGVLQRANRVGW
ncbi:Fic family protein [Curtobacterium pusillum]|uniref:Fic family protein n=1 Tax=Curtobacterium pusillum TaxID=69373 RepID=UPI003815452D